MSRLSNRQVAELANSAADELGAVCRELDCGLLGRMAEAERGIAAGSFDSPSGSHGALAYADPTAEAALRGSDIANIHRAELVRCLQRARKAVRRAAQLASYYPVPAAASAASTAELERLNRRLEPGCQSCARIHVVNGVPRWEPPDIRVPQPTTVGGRFDTPSILCRWCYDRVAAWGRLPTEGELEAHHAGRRVPWPKDVPAPETRK